MDEKKLKKVEHRKLRKKAIKFQNNSSRKVSMAEALVEVQRVKED
jgi:hypothetical protein